LVQKSQLNCDSSFLKNVVNNSVTVSPDKVESPLQSLLIWYKSNRTVLHPFILAFKFHLQFEKIHPFLDGNGRTGRMLMNKILMDQGFFPMIVGANSPEKYFSAISKGISGRTKFYYDFMLREMDSTYFKFSSF